VAFATRSIAFLLGGSKHHFSPGDDPRLIACRLVRQRRRGGFHNKIACPKLNYEFCNTRNRRRAPIYHPDTTRPSQGGPPLRPQIKPQCCADLTHLGFISSSAHDRLLKELCKIITKGKCFFGVYYVLNVNLSKFKLAVRNDSASMRCDYCRGQLGLNVQVYWRMPFCSTKCMCAYQQRLSSETQKKIIKLDQSWKIAS